MLCFLIPYWDYRRRLQTYLPRWKLQPDKTRSCPINLFCLGRDFSFLCCFLSVVCCGARGKFEFMDGSNWPLQLYPRWVALFVEKFVYCFLQVLSLDLSLAILARRRKKLSQSRSICCFIAYFARFDTNLAPVIAKFYMFYYFLVERNKLWTYLMIALMTILTLDSYR